MFLYKLTIVHAPLSKDNPSCSKMSVYHHKAVAHSNNNVTALSLHAHTRTHTHSHTCTRAQVDFYRSLNRFYAQQWCPVARWPLHYARRKIQAPVSKSQKNPTIALQHPTINSVSRSASLSLFLLALLTIKQFLALSLRKNRKGGKKKHISTNLTLTSTAEIILLKWEMWIFKCWNGCCLIFYWHCTNCV